MTTTTKVKKHQHVVPRAYLRGWADSDNHIEVLDRGNKASSRLPVSNSAVRKRFYNCTGPDGAETDAVENWLDKHIEAPAGKTLRALREGADIADVDSAAIIKFTVAQLIRTPTVFAIMDRLDEHLGALLLLREAARSKGLDLLQFSGADRDRYLAVARKAWAAQQNERDTKASKLRTMVRTLEEISTRVTSWHWSVLTSPEPVLIAGDSPVVTLNPIGYHWAGLLPEGSPLCMPLSPTVLLIGEPEKPLGQKSELTSEMAEFVTGALVRQADRSLFNKPGLSWPGGLTFPAKKPTLAEPTVTWRESSAPPTFPATYPPVSSAAVELLLKELDAVDTVE